MFYHVSAANDRLTLELLIVAARLGKKGIYGMGIFTKNMFLAEDRYVNALNQCT